MSRRNGRPLSGADLQLRPLTSVHFDAIKAHIHHLIEELGLEPSQIGRIRLYVIWRYAHETTPHTWLGQVHDFDVFELHLQYFLDTTSKPHAALVDDEGVPLVLELPVPHGTVFDGDVSHAPRDGEPSMVAYLQIVVFYDERDTACEVQVPRDHAWMFINRTEADGNEFPVKGMAMQQPLLIRDSIPTASQVSSVASSNATSRSASAIDVDAHQDEPRREAVFGKLQETLCKDRFEQSTGMIQQLRDDHHAAMRKIDVLSADLAAAQSDAAEAKAEAVRLSQDLAEFSGEFQRLDAAVRMIARNARDARRAAPSGAAAAMAAGARSAPGQAPAAAGVGSFEFTDAATFPVDRMTPAGLAAHEFLVKLNGIAMTGKDDAVKTCFKAWLKTLEGVWDERNRDLTPIARLPGGVNSPDYVQAKEEHDDKLQKHIDSTRALWETAKKGDTSKPTKYEFDAAGAVARSGAARTEDEVKLNAIMSAIAQQATNAATVSMAARRLEAGKHSNPPAAGEGSPQKKGKKQAKPGSDPNGGASL